MAPQKSQVMTSFRPPNVFSWRRHCSPGLESRKKCPSCFLDRKVCRTPTLRDTEIVLVKQGVLAVGLLLKPAGAQGSQGPRSTRITWSTRTTRNTRVTRNTRSARITRTTSAAVRNAWSTLGIGSMRVRFNGGQV